MIWSAYCDDDGDGDGPTTLMSGLSAALQVDEEEAAGEPDRPIEEEKNQNLETNMLMKIK